MQTGNKYTWNDNKETEIMQNQEKIMYVVCSVCNIWYFYKPILWTNQNQ